MRHFVFVFLVRGRYATISVAVDAAADDKEEEEDGDDGAAADAA